MALTVNVYDVTNNVSGQITVDFACEILADSTEGTYNPEQRYFFKFTTASKDQDNLPYIPRVVKDFGELALNKTVRSASNSTTDYATIKELVDDYIYDYINGHDADQFLSGASYRAPMKIKN